MNWQKLGLIFTVNENNEWMNSHASLPFAVHLNGDIHRIIFSTRDINNRSYGAFIDVKLPKKIINISSKNILKPGNLGTFSDSGVSLSCLVNDKLYFLGWNLLKTVPFSNNIGLAKYVNNEFKLISSAPIIPKCDKEPNSFGYPFVLFHNNIYKMWYDTIIEWRGNTTNDYLCSLRYAESKDGINWGKKYIDCIELKQGEKCITRPSVIIENNLFKMWYSINNNGIYRIGYAESKNGIDWIRKDDEVGITVSENGWDSEEIEYPFVFDHIGERYMLYNGNGYGKTGFGLAKLIK